MDNTNAHIDSVVSKDKYGFRKFSSPSKIKLSSYTGVDCCRCPYNDFRGL